MNSLMLFFGTLLVIVLSAIVMSLPTMWLWNWLMPTIFGLIKITFWQALGLNILAGTLFKSTSSSN